MSLFPPPALQSIYGSVLSTVTLYPSQPPPINSVAVTDGIGGSYFVPLADLVPEIPFTTISTTVLAASTILLKDNTSNSQIYVEGGQLYVNNAPVGGAIDSNYAFSNLRVMDTLSTSSTFTEFLSASQLLTSSIAFQESIRIESGTDALFPQSIAIGAGAGIAQNQYAIAIGANAAGGEVIQGSNAIAIGFGAGFTTQGSNAVAIGANAGLIVQGDYSIAIGYDAGRTSQQANTIILNATGGEVNGVDAQPYSFYVTPVRSDNTTGNTLFYNPTTFEITYGAGGSAIDSNYAFSNLRIEDTLSTTSTFTDFISTNAIFAEYISTYSMTVFGPNTLTVQGNTVLSTIIVSGQISTVGTAPFATDLTLESLTLQNPDTLATQTMFTSTISQGTVTQAFDYTGETQTFTVPAGVTKVRAILYGAGGKGNTTDYALGGNGARIEGDIAVTPGEILTLLVGQGGQEDNTAFGGGGLYGGGGRSEIVRNGTSLAIAGAGGGGGLNNGSPTDGPSRGGTGGIASGEALAGEAFDIDSTGEGGSGGGGGSQSSGGSAGIGDGQIGTEGTGGNGASGTLTGGGGGGGYWGGGGGGNGPNGSSGGGGGSSFIGGLSGSISQDAGGRNQPTQYDSLPGHTGIIAYGAVGGETAGDGRIVLSYTIEAIFSDIQVMNKLILRNPDTLATQTMFTSTISEQPVIQAFDYSVSGEQVFTVPAGVTKVRAILYGAGGSAAVGGAGYGGNGARIEGDILVTPGETLTLLVGQGGQTDTIAVGGGGLYGGGGRSEIARNGTPLAIAGAGGGGGSASGNGGSGGTSTIAGGAGEDGAGATGGTGGTDSAGGTGGTGQVGGQPGDLGTGGDGANSDPYYGGGGGGGYYGGGGGGASFDAFTSASGGGGSSYVGGMTGTPDENPGISGSADQYDGSAGHKGNVAYGNQGFNNGGDGRIVLIYTPEAIFSDKQYISSLTSEYVSTTAIYAGAGIIGPFDGSVPNKAVINGLNTIGDSFLTRDTASGEIGFSPFRMEAGTYISPWTDGASDNIIFTTQFNNTPVVVATVLTNNTNNYSIVIKGLTETGFILTQKEDTLDGSQPVNWIAYGQ